MLHSAVVLVSVALAVAFLPLRASATEYWMTLYSVDTDRIAAAIGSGDKGLEARMLADTEAVEWNRLTGRYRTPDLWKTAVRDLIAGRERPNESVNGFALVLLLRASTTPAERHEIDLPFVDFEILSRYLDARGDSTLARLSKALTGMAVWHGRHRLALADKLGPMGYHAYAVPVANEDLSAILADWPVIDRSINEVEALLTEDDSPLARTAITAIARAEERQARAFYSANPDYIGEGESLDDAVARSVATVIDDPYPYTDHFEILGEEAEGIRAFLQQAAAAGRDVVFVYGNS